MQSNDSIDELVSLAKDADHILTENARKIVLDMLHQGVKPNASDFDKILSLGIFFDNETANQIGTAKTNQIQSYSNDSNGLCTRGNGCISWRYLSCKHIKVGAGAGLAQGSATELVGSGHAVVFTAAQHQVAE